MYASKDEHALAILRRCEAHETPAAHMAATIKKLSAPPSQLAELVPDFAKGRKIEPDVARVWMQNAQARAQTWQFIVANRERIDVNAVLVALVPMGRPIADVDISEGADKAALRKGLGALIDAKSPDVLGRVLASLAITGVDDPIKEKLAALVRHEAESIRLAAAELLGQDDLLATARLPGLVADLRSDSPTRRQLAARQLESLKAEDPRVTAALVRAVENRDMVAREGLILGIERAWKEQKKTMDILSIIAKDKTPGGDGVRARKALAEIEKGEK
jgi:hypothetical protein